MLRLAEHIIETKAGDFDPVVLDGTLSFAGRVKGRWPVLLRGLRADSWAGFLGVCESTTRHPRASQAAGDLPALQTLALAAFAFPPRPFGSSERTGASSINANRL